MNTQATVKKKWYEKPEKWANFVGLAIAGVFAFKFLDVIMPMVQRVLEMIFHSTLYFIGTAALVSVVAWIITSKDLHKLVWYGYETLMRHLTSLVINIDPISIMKSYLKSLRNNLEELKSSLGVLIGQQRKLEAKIEETVKSFQQNMKLAAQAQKNQDQAGMKNALRLYSRKSKRREESHITYQGLLNRVKAHIALAKKIKEASEFMITDIEDTIEDETEKRDMIKASYKAMNAAKRILASNAQREMYDMALESVTKDYYSKLGEIEQFMEDSQHFVNTMDLQNGIYEEEALQRLEEWDKRSELLLSGGTGKTRYRVEKEHIEEDMSRDANPPAFASLFSNLD